MHVVPAVILLVAPDALARRPRTPPPAPLAPAEVVAPRVVAHALPGDVVELTAPCALTREGSVWCWGSAGGSHALREMDLPPVQDILPMSPGVCGWTGATTVCSPEVDPPLAGGLGMGDVWFDATQVVFPRGYRPDDHFVVRPGATEVVVTGCASWDFDLVWQVDGDLHADCTSADLSPLTGAPSIDAQGQHLCGVHTDGTVACVQLYGGEPISESVVVPGIQDAVDVSVGDLVACVLHETGRVSCFGYDRYLEGHLGDALTHWTDPHPPVDLGVSDVTAIDLRHDGFCFAQGPVVQCLDPDFGPAPVPVDGLPAVTDAGFYDEGGCARDTTGAVWCWEASTGWTPRQTGLEAAVLADRFALTATGDLYERSAGTWLLHTEALWPSPPATARLWAYYDTVCLLDSGTEARCIGELSPPDDPIETYHIVAGRLWREQTAAPVPYAGEGRWTVMEVEGGRATEVPAHQRVAAPSAPPPTDPPSLPGDVVLTAISGDLATDASGQVYRLTQRGTYLSPDPSARPTVAPPAGPVQSDSRVPWSCHLDGHRVVCAGRLYDGDRPLLPGLPPRTRVGPDEVALDLPPVAAISAHPWRDLVAIGADGQAWTPDMGHAPAPVHGLPPVVDAAAGHRGGCGLTSAGTLWCWGQGAPRPVSENVRAVGGESEVVWLDAAGDLWQWSGSRPRLLRDAHWPDPPPDVRVRGSHNGGCAWVPGDDKRCWGSQPPPDGPIEDWSYALVVHSTRGLLDANDQWARLEGPSGHVRLLYAGPRVWADGQVWLCLDRTCEPEARVGGVGARGGLIVDAAGRAVDAEGRPVIDGVARLGDGDAVVILANGTVWSTGAPGHGGWRPLPARSEQFVPVPSAVGTPTW